MAQFHPAWREYRRRYFIRPNGKVWMRPNAHLSIRHDAHRFMPPGSPRYVGKDVVRYFWPDAGSQLPAQEWNAAERAELLAIKSELAELIAIRRERAELQAIKEELAKIRFEIKFRRLLRDFKAGFNPNQPRVPAGSHEGGQWTSGSGADGAGRNDSRVLSDATPDNEWKPGAQYAAARPQGGPPPSRPPEVPQQRPSTVPMRNRIAREVARWRGPIGIIYGAAKWLYEHHPEIQAYRGPPKTLEELQQAATEPRMLGYDDHHIVGQAARKEKDKNFPDSWIDSPENIVRISRYKHWEINSWYETPNRERPFNGLSPREHLRGKDWSERYQMGLEVLFDSGVLKP
jgi:hypothetical protein